MEEGWVDFMMEDVLVGLLMSLLTLLDTELIPIVLGSVVVVDPLTREEDVKEVMEVDVMYGG